MKSTNTSGNTVIEEIVNRNLCAGCGVCAGICSSNLLKMKFNRYGEYVPIYLEGRCRKHCGLCLKVCPFFNNEYDEDKMAEELFAGEIGIFHRPETGYSLESYAGHILDEERRSNAASGGLATWFLAELLKKDIVDRVICVTPEDKIGNLFKFTSTDSLETVIGSSKSCYYPVELSSIIEEIKSTELRYGIIALPCYVKALRLAMQHVPEIAHRIEVTVGLTCGHNNGKLFAEYLCALSGGDPETLSAGRFRVKGSGRHVNDYGFSYESMKGRKSGTIFWSEGMGAAWARGYFKLNACNYCDDIFAELADIVFMDAWLPRYMSDPRGANLMVVRRRIDEIVNAGVESGAIYAEQVPIEDVIESQAAVILEKRDKLAKRLSVGKHRERSSSNKRVEPTKTTFLEGLQLVLERMITTKSKKLFSEQRSRLDISYFDRKISMIQFIQRIVNHFATKLGDR